MATGSTTKQTLLVQIDNKVATANATELSQLAKSLNKTLSNESIISSC